MTPTVENRRAETIRKQIRGSGLLLCGNFLSLGIAFWTQVLIARYLSTDTYGIWAYALSVVALCGGFARIGLVDAVARFVPLYHEHRDYSRLLGTIVLGTGAILASSGTMVAVLRLMPQQWWIIHQNHRALELVLIALFLIPLEAVDALLMSLFACFAKPRSIFFRRHVLSPGLKLLVVLLLILRHSPVVFMAYGYLFASALGVGVYTCLLWRVLNGLGLLQRVNWHQIRMPARQIFAFALPGLTSEVVAVLYLSVAPLVLGFFHPMTAVASYRVVVPAAVLNTTVMMAFTFLYTPSAARLVARADMAGVNALYWKTAAWVSVLSFPIFAATFCFSRAVTLSLYGARYEQSAAVLSILALGYYFNAALGLNGLTLKVLGKLRYLIVINIVVAIVNCGANVLLIPRFGIRGAALATSGSMILHNVLKQVGLKRYSGARLLEMEYIPLYVTIALCSVGLWLHQLFRPNSVYGAAVLAVMISIFILRRVRDSLKISEAFPESLKIPLLRKLVA